MRWSMADDYKTRCDVCGTPLYDEDYFYILRSEDPKMGTHIHVCEDCMLKERKNVWEWWNTTR